MPLYVARVHVVGTYPGLNSNFAIWIGPATSACGIVILATSGCRLLVHAVIGTGSEQPVYDATLLTGGGGTVSLVNSSGVAWSIDEVR